MTGLAVDMTHLCPRRPELGSANSLQRISLFQGCWSYDGFIQPPHYPFHQLLTLHCSGLGDKGLTDKATFYLLGSDHCVLWVENRIKVYQTKGVSKFIASEGMGGWQRKLPVQIWPHLHCYTRTPGKLVGLCDPNVWMAWVFVDQRLCWGRGNGENLQCIWEQCVLGPLFSGVASYSLALLSRHCLPGTCKGAIFLAV